MHREVIFQSSMVSKISGIVRINLPFVNHGQSLLAKVFTFIWQQRIKVSEAGTSDIARSLPGVHAIPVLRLKTCGRYARVENYMVMVLTVFQLNKVKAQNLIGSTPLNNEIFLPFNTTNAYLLLKAAKKCLSPETKIKISHPCQTHFFSPSVNSFRSATLWFNALVKDLDSCLQKRGTTTVCGTSSLQPSFWTQQWNQFSGMDWSCSNEMTYREKQSVRGSAVAGRPRVNNHY